MATQEQQRGEFRLARRTSDAEVNATFKGAIDMHIHAGPGIRRARPSIVELAQRCLEMGEAGFVAKRAEFPSVADVEIVNKIMNGKPVKVFGSIVLSSIVGGLNPSAVEEAVLWENCKVMWMPTGDAANHYRKERTRFTGTAPGIEIITEKGQLKDEVKEILEIVAKARHRVCVATGHASIEEALKLVEACTAMNIPVVATHVSQEVPNFTLDEMKEIVKRKGYLEIVAMQTVPNLYHPEGDIFRVQEIVNSIGSENIVLSTDYGQAFSPNPIEGFKFFIRVLLDLGIDKKAMETMVKVNPRKILGIESE